MKARIVDGWLVVPCDAPDLATVHIGWGKTRPTTWHPAFRDWRDGVRIAQVRAIPPSGAWNVWLRVNNVQTSCRLIVP